LSDSWGGGGMSGLSFTASALKDACRRIEASGHKRTATEDYEYYDSM